MRISDGSSDVCSSDLLSHLNYSGRGKRSSKADAHHQMTRDAMRQLFEQAWDDVQHGRETDFVSGHHDADAVLLPQWVAARAIGRASCRERVWQDGWTTVADAALKNKTQKTIMK